MLCPGILKQLARIVNEPGIGSKSLWGRGDSRFHATGEVIQRRVHALSIIIGRYGDVRAAGRRFPRTANSHWSPKGGIFPIELQKLGHATMWYQFHQNAGGRTPLHSGTGIGEGHVHSLRRCFDPARRGISAWGISRYRRCISPGWPAGLPSHRAVNLWGNCSRAQNSRSRGSCHRLRP